MNENDVTSLKDLEKYANDNVIKLSDFDTNKPLIVRLRRPSVYSLLCGGKIPNELLTSAYGLFVSSKKEMKPKMNDIESYKEIIELLKVVANASLVNPTMHEIESKGLELTEKQLMEIYEYVQGGLRGLVRFRAISKGNTNNKDGKNVQQNAK